MKHGNKGLNSLNLSLLGLSLLVAPGVMLAGKKDKEAKQESREAKRKKGCKKKDHNGGTKIIDVALNGRVQADPNCNLTTEQRQAEPDYDLKTKPIYNYLSYNFEPIVAVNPKDPSNMIMATRVADLSRENPIFYTLDGGKTWQWVEIPVNRCQAPVVEGALNDFGVSADPWVTFDKDGNAYASFVAANQLFNENGSRRSLDSGVVVIKSTDKGQSWNAPTRPYYFPGPGGSNLPDKPAIYGSTKNSGTVFLTYHNEGVTVTTYQRSTDGGNFFEEPLVFTYEDVVVNGIPIPPVYIWGAAVTTLPDGTILLSARNSLFDTNIDIGFGPGQNELIYINKSTDGGKTFGPTIVALPSATQNFAYDAPNGYVVRDTATWHDIAVNKCNGYVYIVTQDSTFYPNAEPDGFEFLGAGNVIIMSKDGGETWSEKIPVNPTTVDSQAYMATLAVLDDGTVGVFYYTDRNHIYQGDDGSEVLQTDVYLSLFDKDLNFLGEKRITKESFNLRRGPVLPFLGFPMYFIGDYLKCATDGKDFLTPLAIPFSNAPGFPAPPTVDEYTEVTDRQWTKFARVSLKHGFDHCQGKRSQAKKAGVGSTKPLIKAAVSKMVAQPEWPQSVEEIKAARESRRNR